LLLQTWTKEDLPTLDNEKAIWENWNIQLPSVALINAPRNFQSNKVSWIAPPEHTFKLNFDGASKGNPGKAGYGGIFRDHAGKHKLIYFGNIGWDTNNSAEMEGLWQGLLLARAHNYLPLEVEGDSQILINMVKQLLNGSHSSKIATSWRLEARLEAIELELLNNRAIIFSHVKREGNKVADIIANLGVESNHTLLTGSINITPNNEKIQECNQLVQEEATPSDAGDP